MAVGPDRADALREGHFGLLREAIESYGGREVKTTGDGLMVAFRSASAAVDCAVTMQQLLDRNARRAGTPLQIRVGLGAGETTLEGGDYFGRPAVEAARLCQKADPGGILASAAVRLLAERSEAVEFESIGQLELKGFSTPTEAFAVLWEPLPEESARATGGWPLPAELAAPSGAYVGRRAERAQIDQLQVAARHGARRIVFLSGEPGIGKTRLATHTAKVAHGDGFAVLWGSCSDELAVPYEPWIGICTQLVDHAPQEVLDRYVERSGGEIGRLARNLVRRVPTAPPPQPSDPETERFLLLGAMTDLLRSVSETRPVCLVIDDLHSSDGQSVALLKHVSQRSTQDPLLVLVTYRDSELSKDHPLTATLADLRLLDGVERIALSGLAEDEIAEMMSAAAGHALSADGWALAGEIANQTGGNPFFVVEVLRSLAESGMLLYDESTDRWTVDRSAPVRLPESVRDVIDRRIQRLGDEVHGLLVPASVIGNSFDVELLGELVDLGEGVVLDRLEAAVAASLLVESNDRVGRFSFVHALINQCLYEGLGATRRAKLHHRVALALEALGFGQHDERLGELALHWRLATTPVASNKAAEYARRAGQRALASLAPAEAARLFADAVELSAEGDARERCEALIGLGEAQRQTGDGAYRDTLLDASRIAHRLGDAEFAAAAALANNSGTYSVIGQVDAERVEAIEWALEIDDPPSPARRGRLLALEALEFGWDPDVPRRRALADEAVRLARQTGDARVLASVLRNAILATTSPETLERRVELAADLAMSAERAQDPALMFWAEVARFNVTVESAELTSAEQALDEMERIALDLDQPLLSWNAAYGRAGWALPRGHLATGEEMSERAFQVGQQAGEPNAALIYGGQLAFLRAYQGRGDEVLGVLEQSVASFPHVSGWRAGLASCYCQANRHAQAAEVVEGAARDNFQSVYADQGQTTALALYADAAYECKLPRVAAILYELIEPWADQIAWNGATMFGHGSMPLALLAATLGWHDRADEHFAIATSKQEAMGLLLWATRAYLGWAETLAGRGDRTGARDKAGRALALAREYGYAGFEARAAAVLGDDSRSEVDAARI
jgi:hypothetical protein